MLKNTQLLFEWVENLPCGEPFGAGHSCTFISYCYAGPETKYGLL